VNLVFLGAPGSGKGTQAARLAQKLALAHLSTGDLLRAAVQDSTELGLKARQYMDIGELVPDDIIVGLLDEKLAAGALNGGCILDGFPRTMPQAQALDTLFGRAGRQIDNALVLLVDDDEIIKRLSGRRYCTQCQAGYHDSFHRPKVAGICDACGGTLARRPDDEPEVIKHRLAVYRAQTRPIEGYYRGKSVLVEIAGMGTPDEIFARVLKGLGIN
jgi:adenylate kinase